MLTVPALIGPVVGPPLGGFITTYLSWRWIFWINVPIGVLGIILVTRFIPDPRGAVAAARSRRLRCSPRSGSPACVFGFETHRARPPARRRDGPAAGRRRRPAPLYVRHARRRAAHPVIDLSLLRIPTFRASVPGGFLFRIGIGATPFLLPLMLQLGFGITPFESGLLTFAAAVGAMA